MLTGTVLSGGAKLGDSIELPELKVCNLCQSQQQVVVLSLLVLPICNVKRLSAQALHVCAQQCRRTAQSCHQKLPKLGAVTFCSR